MRKSKKSNKPAITVKDVIDAGYIGEHMEIMYSFIVDMVNSGHYKNERDFLLNKLKTLELKDVHM